MTQPPEHRTTSSDQRHQAPNAAPNRRFDDRTLPSHLRTLHAMVCMKTHNAVALISADQGVANTLAGLRDGVLIYRQPIDRCRATIFIEPSR